MKRQVRSQNRLKVNNDSNSRQNENKLVKSDSFTKNSFLKRFTRQNSCRQKLNSDIEVNMQSDRKISDSHVNIVRRESNI